jgi:O-antigen/teichoic acid export membrane protein
VLKRIAAPTIGLLRYGVAIAGPIGSAGAQFLLSLVLLKTLDPAAFGRFSFLLIASQLSWGIWSALFCAPLPILMSLGDVAERERALRGLMTMNLLGAAGAGFLFFGVTLALGERPAGAALFGIYASVALLRWFARAHAYATGAPLRTTASDLVYSVILLCGAGLLAVSRVPSANLAWAITLAGAIAGLLPFGNGYLRRQFASVDLRDASATGPVWRGMAAWSLTGVLAIEGTANAHVYLVTAFQSAAAFAPLAASSLVIRPISVAINAITDFERPRLVHLLNEGARRDIGRALRFLRVILLFGWLVTIAAVAVFMVRAPYLVFPPRYDQIFLQKAAMLWMMVAGVRLLRTPDAALLQAAGRFRALASSSAISALVSIGAVLILLATSGALWSIAGILLGETVFAVLVWRDAHMPGIIIETCDDSANDPDAFAMTR